ncbi:zinc-dependent metalloprotease family protein [Solemya velum gill symbiont]|uniref:zinc-dependent metalloprotease family protein n=1 Tax=Solemya velum gill symbiont TaxID=2340 RepID=UPI0009967555|nr:zinc-dependent metalloprotease family protein [Solemya velum gill symbiont]OOZ44762.1 hypothetical protein BOW37_05635 [Solemya velum gill symbiont]OOZ46888.1 hypothetical protein BOW38_05855 [Solemya velum gill symbiont]OOZ50591.1 hypothetical protein BOW39_02220 [Solemya velum gill symbiont]OOZ51836.1 hypothetical protein BOW40_05695 [Solemya velum gill symbiont]OOZ54378.1 hypothetical protein BOW41_06400 [Solemya velum gill symbiont]
MYIVPTAARLTAILLLGIFPVSLATANPPVDLFKGPPSWAIAGQYGISAIEVEFDTAGPEKGAQRLRLTLPGGEQVELERDGFESRGPGNKAWRGRVVGNEDSRAVLTLHKGKLAGRLRIAGDLYEIRPQRGRKITMEKLDPQAFPECSTNADMAVVDPEYDAKEAFAAGEGEPVTAADETIEVIDLLSVYTPLARTKAGGTDVIEAMIQSAVDSGNAAFIDSGMDARFRLVHMAETDYTDSGDQLTDLEALQDTNDGEMDEVHGLRNTYGADMVSLIDDSTGECGLGYVQKTPGPSFAVDAFQTTDIDCLLGNLTFTHEHGHGA